MELQMNTPRNSNLESIQPRGKKDDKAIKIVDKGRDQYHSSSSSRTPGIENRTALRGICSSAELPPGDDTGEGNIDDGADDPREDPGRNRDMRILSDVSEPLEWGVDGLVDVTVVDDTDAADRPGVLTGTW